MKKIIIPTDFSKNAWNTLIYAIKLYENTPCEFYLLNAYDLDPVQLLTTVSSQRIGHFYGMLKKDSEHGLEIIIEEIQKYKSNLDHTFKTISKRGSLVSVINELVDQSLFDILVIGTKGATGAKEIFLGSNTQNVIKNVDCCPILVIPEDFSFQKISEIAFATDFERLYHKAEVEPILEFAKKHDATIRMIHIYDEPKLDTVQQYNSSTLEHYFKHVKYEFHVIPDFSTIENAIQAFMEELEIDILMMIYYKHSFLERILKEPVIKKMTFHTNIPFLVIPEDTTIVY